MPAIAGAVSSSFLGNYSIDCVGLGFVGRYGGTPAASFGAGGVSIALVSFAILFLFVSASIAVFLNTTHEKRVDRYSISRGVVPTKLLALFCGSGACRCFL